MISELFDALEPAMLTACLESLNAHKGEHFYSVALYTSGEYGYILPTVATFEGLESVAREYLAEETYEQKWQTIDVAMRELKWSPADSPYHCEFEDSFDKTNEILSRIWEQTNDSEEQYLDTCVQIYETCMNVLASVRNSDIFEGHEVIFNLLMGDQSDEERLANAAALNPRELVKKFRSELEIDDDILRQYGVDLI